MSRIKRPKVIPTVIIGASLLFVALCLGQKNLSELQVGVPLTAYHLAVSGYPHSARELIPHHWITYSIEELLAGQDKELELALKMARRS